MQAGKSITLRQIFFLLYLSQTAGAPFFLNLLVIPEAGMAAWQLLALGIGFLIVGTYLVIKLAAIYPAENCITALPKLLGKTIGIVTTVLLMGYFLFQVLYISRGIAEVTRLGLLRTTPQWITALLFLCPAAYATTYGITPIARIVDAIVFFGFPLVSLSFISALPNINLDFFTGFWVWKPSMFTSLNFFGTFNYMSGFILLYVLYPYIQATPRQIMGSSFLAGAVAFIFMYIPAIYLPLLTFGPEGILEYRTPLYTTIELSPVSLYIVENINLLFYSLWSIFSFAGCSLFLFCAITLLFSLIPVRKGLWLIPFALVPPLSYMATIVSLTQFLPALHYAGLCSLFLGIMLPAFLLLIHALRRRKERPDEAMENL